VTPPRRQLGLWVAAAIVVANMIGAGVFTSAGFQAAGLNDPLTMLLTWVVGGFLALCGAACYAELGALMPRAGGEYVYLREAYHPVVGFMSGWVSLTAGFSAPIAAAALAFSAYLSQVVPGLETSLAQKVVASALIVLVSAMHAFDTKLGGRVQTGFTIAKVLLILVFIVAGLLFGTGSWDNLASPPEYLTCMLRDEVGGACRIAIQSSGETLGQLGTTAGLMAFATSLMYVSFAYSGWNAAAYIAGEIERPQRTLPRALLLGTAIVMVLYLMLNLVFLYAAAPGEMWNVKEVGDLAARRLFGNSAGSMLSTMIALALVSSVSAMLMAGPRVYAAMAADHALPTPLARYTKRGVPAIAVITQCVIAIICVMAGDLKQLIEFAIFALSISAALTVAAVFVFRARGKLGPYRTFGYPITPILFVGLSAMIVVLQFMAKPKQSAIVLGVIAAGGLLYAFTTAGKGHIKIEADEDEPPGD
jgi:APA family basic amino acid/polyamine antiporter